MGEGWYWGTLPGEKLTGSYQNVLLFNIIETTVHTEFTERFFLFSVSSVVNKMSIRSSISMLTA